jgi:hypothetical protein
MRRRTPPSQRPIINCKPEMTRFSFFPNLAGVGEPPPGHRVAAWATPVARGGSLAMGWPVSHPSSSMVVLHFDWIFLFSLLFFIFFLN